MLFWTLVLIAFTIIKMIKGGFFKETLIKIAELTIKEYNPETTTEEKKILQTESFKIGWKFMLFGLGLAVVYITYLLNAINLDPLKYPTIIMMAWIMLAFIKGFVSKKVDLSTDENRKIYLAKAYLSNKRTLRGTIVNFGFLGYFWYMFYLLVLA